MQYRAVDRDPLKYIVYRRSGLGVFTAHFMAVHNNMQQLCRHQADEADIKVWVFEKEALASDLQRGAFDEQSAQDDRTTEDLRIPH